MGLALARANQAALLHVPKRLEDILAYIHLGVLDRRLLSRLLVPRIFSNRDALPMKRSPLTRSTPLPRGTPIR
jgi:hypothetical protein